MPRSKAKPQTEPALTAAPPMNGPADEVLTLPEAAAYLRLSESQVLRLVDEQKLPARRLANDWRFLKTAIQTWLSQPLAKPAKDFWEASLGAFKDDPYLEEIVKEAYRRRGQTLAEDD